MDNDIGKFIKFKPSVQSTMKLPRIENDPLLSTGIY